MIYAKMTATKSARAANRVREHGDTFLFNKTGIFNGNINVLVHCLSIHDPKCDWFGWFSPDEADWEFEGAIG